MPGPLLHNRTTGLAELTAVRGMSMLTESLALAFGFKEFFGTDNAAALAGESRVYPLTDCGDRFWCRHLGNLKRSNTIAIDAREGTMRDGQAGCEWLPTLNIPRTQCQGLTFATQRLRHREPPQEMRTTPSALATLHSNAGTPRNLKQGIHLRVRSSVVLILHIQEQPAP